MNLYDTTTSVENYFYSQVGRTDCGLQAVYMQEQEMQIVDLRPDGYISAWRSFGAINT